MAAQRTNRGVGLIVIWSAIAGAVGGGVNAHAGQLVADEATLYGWIFGKNRLQNEIDPDAARRRLESNLEYKLIWIDVKCGLTEEQRSKLRLAGETQITHFLDQVDEKKRVFLDMKDDPSRVKSFLQELRPIQDAWTVDPFSQQSFFWKTLRKTLSQAQVAEAEKFFKELEENEWRERLRAFVRVEGDILGLNETQRPRLLTLLTKHTGPTHKLVSYQWRGLLSQVARIPEEELTSILEEKQWRKLKEELDLNRLLLPSLDDICFREHQGWQMGAANPIGRR